MCRYDGSLCSVKDCTLRVLLGVSGSRKEVGSGKWEVESSKDGEEVQARWWGERSAHSILTRVRKVKN